MAKFEWNAGPRINADMVALGRKPMNAQNFINQLMVGAKLVEESERARIFTDAKGKYRLEAHKTHNTVERIMKKSAVVDGEKVEFYGQYTLTTHALDRYRERFSEKAAGKNDAEITTHINNLLKLATLQAQTVGKEGLVHHYNAAKQNIRIIVNKAQKRVVTVHQIVEQPQVAPVIEKDSPIFGAIIAATKRELKRATTNFRKRNRELTEQLASIQIEIAHAMVNKTRAKGDHIVERVEAKLMALEGEMNAIKAELEREMKQYSRIKDDATRVIGG